MTYEDPACAYCPDTRRACRRGESETRGPGYCPIAFESGVVESEGYCKWTRLEETVQFAKHMGYKKIGVANCIAFVDHAYVLSGILESHGFEVVSVACKNGGVPKEEMGIADGQKVHPGQFEAMCNPISQAELLNHHGCEFNVLLGLCVGHDSLFFRYSKALVTVLVAKDRVLAHNPIGALNLADSYYRKVWGPDKPAKPPTLPPAGRRNAKTDTPT